MKKVSLVFLALFIFSCEAVFVEDISSDTVVLQAPMNSVILTAGNITFSWQLLEAADFYQIQIATPNFQNAMQIIIDSITTENSVVKNLTTGDYQWRVKAINSAYETPHSTTNIVVN